MKSGSTQSRPPVSDPSSRPTGSAGHHPAAIGGDVLSRVRLLEEVWGYPSAVVTRTVDTHVAELRRKLEDDPAEPRHIMTVRKAGYRLER